ncbi:MAG: potassium-transporting ATPase subunit KdpC [Candidatus Hydrogenedentota bacterium]
MKTFLKTLRQSAITYLLMFLLCGVLYPLAVTFAAQAIFPAEAEGSLVRVAGRVVGSSLLAQSFTDSRAFHSRPSACGYGTMSSAASNAGPTSGALRTAIDARAAAIDGGDTNQSRRLIPAHLLTASGSGLDPHLPPQAVLYQLERVTAARGWTADEKERAAKTIHRLTEPRVLGIFGEERVNILRLNMELGR